MNILYVVGTPIGNLDDITLRSIKTLESVGLIAAEDTRKTLKLLRHHGIKTKTISYDEQGNSSKVKTILKALTTRDVALVTDAGMPNISDPGYSLIQAAIQNSVKVVPIPGPSAVTTALAVSGLPTEPFKFIGFIPRKAGDRRRYLIANSRLNATIVAFEAPHRLQKSLLDMLEILGDRSITVCRELTKKHEEIFIGLVSEAIDHFREPLGEITIVIEPGIQDSSQSYSETKETRSILANIHGKKAREAVTEIAAIANVSRKEAYRLWLKHKDAGKSR